LAFVKHGALQVPRHPAQPAPMRRPRFVADAGRVLREQLDAACDAKACPRHLSDLVAVPAAAGAFRSPGVRHSMLKDTQNA
jgi:hypothetical protein